MTQKVFIYIKDDRIKSYFNLSELAKDNPDVSYQYAQKSLRTTSQVKIKQYSITVCKMEYKTKRTLNKQTDDGNY